MFLLRNNSKLRKHIGCVLQFGCSNFYTNNAPKLAILSSKIEKFSDCPLPRPLLQWGGGHPLTTSHTLGAFGTSILAPSALDLVTRQPNKVGQHWISQSVFISSILLRLFTLFMQTSIMQGSDVVDKHS